MKGRIPGRDEMPYDVTGLDLSGRILELGPGNGQLEPLVAAAGGEWVAVDKDPRAGVIELDYSLFPARLPHGPFNGVYCRGSIATSWDLLPLLAGQIHMRLAYPAWCWISLWHSPASPEWMLRDALELFRHELGCLHDVGAKLPSNQHLVTRGVS